MVIKNYTDAGFDYSRIYYKVIDPDGHNGLKYGLGLNIDPLPFDDDPSHSCTPGGIYFTDGPHLGGFYKYGSLVAEVRVPEGARVVKDPHGDKWRADRIEISGFIDKVEFLSRLPEQEGDLILHRIRRLEGVKLPDVKGDLLLYDIGRIEGLEIGRVGGMAQIAGIRWIKNLSAGDIGGDLYLHDITEMDGARFLNIGGILFLANIGRMENVGFDNIGADLRVDNVKESRNITISRMGLDFYFPGLRRIEDIRFGGIGGDMYIGVYPKDLDKNKVKGDIYVEGEI